MVHLYIIIFYIGIININQALESLLVFQGYIEYQSRKLLNKRVLKGIRLYIHLLDSPGSYPASTALLFDRCGRFLM